MHAAHQGGADATMMAVVTTGTGGYDRLDYRRVPRPVPGPGEVLLQVLGAGVNNTDINTRVGWYSSDVRDATNDTGAAGDRSDGGWNARTPFPFIQGTDCCGRIVAVGPGGEEARIGERCLVRSCMRMGGFDCFDTVWIGSDFDGAFAQYVKAPATEVFAVESDWSDAELASIPCAYGTAENMIHRAGVTKGTRLLVPGASGGVGTALIQLARRRGAEVIAITSPAKRSMIEDLGADLVLSRDGDVVSDMGAECVDVVIDNVAGPGFGAMLKLLRRGGCYVSSGAIAGPVVSLDMRDMYLKDITLIGCTAWDEPVFGNLIRYIEADEIRPLVAATYPLDQIAEVQAAFQSKQHMGKFVLIPPH